MKAFFVTDSLGFLAPIKAAFEKYFPAELHVRQIGTNDLSYEDMVQWPVDIIVVDLLSRESAATVKTITLIRKSCNSPIIAITSFENKSLAVNLKQQDIEDYLIDTDMNPALLGKTVMYAIERKQSQQLIAQNSKYMMALASRLSHDFSGHIRIIDAGLRILQDDISLRLPLEPDEKEWFDLMMQRADIMKNQIDDLVVLLKATHKERRSETIDLNFLLREVDQSIKNSTDLDYKLIVSDLPAITGDPGLLAQAFQNLIFNGVIYNKNSPTITVRPLEKPADDQVSIMVEDNGIGIEQCHIGSIYEPFSRLHRDGEYKGTGLGLSIVKTIIEQARGTIAVESQTDIGSRFILSLPINQH